MKHDLVVYFLQTSFIISGYQKTRHLHDTVVRSATAVSMCAHLATSFCYSTQLDSLTNL